MSEYQIKPCRCGAFDGWYERHVKYYAQYYNADGADDFADDGENRKSYGGTVKYCATCHRVITSLIQPKPQG